jgi:hypothetical protein
VGDRQQIYHTTIAAAADAACDVVMRCVLSYDCTVSDDTGVVCVDTEDALCIEMLQSVLECGYIWRSLLDVAGSPLTPCGPLALASVPVLWSWLCVRRLRTSVPCNRGW